MLYYITLTSEKKGTKYFDFSRQIESVKTVRNETTISRDAYRLTTYPYRLHFSGTLTAVFGFFKIFLVKTNLYNKSPTESVCLSGCVFAPVQAEPFDLG